MSARLANRACPHWAENLLFLRKSDVALDTPFLRLRLGISLSPDFEFGRSLLRREKWPFQPPGRQAPVASQGNYHIELISASARSCLWACTSIQFSGHHSARGERLSRAETAAKLMWHPFLQRKLLPVWTRPEYLIWVPGCHLASGRHIRSQGLRGS